MRTWALAIALVLASIGATPPAGLASDGAPLPGDVRIMPPPPGLSDEAAYLLGTWEGEWRTSLGVEPEAEILLVVEALNPIKGKARVVYAWNWKTDSPLAPPHTTGHIRGLVEFTQSPPVIRWVGRNHYRFELKDKILHGTVDHADKTGRAKLTKTD